MKRDKTPNQQLLLLEDVNNLGRKGDLVKAKSGFVRNFLLPQKKAVIADKRTLRIQKQLQEERLKQAAIDRKESEAFATKIKGNALEIEVKTDKEGHLYGSVGAVDIVKLLEKEEGILLERRHIILQKPLKKVGTYEIELRLKEEVYASFFLKVKGEGQIIEAKTYVEVMDEETQEKGKEEIASEVQEDLPTLDEQKASAQEEIEERSKE